MIVLSQQQPKLMLPRFQPLSQRPIPWTQKIVHNPQEYAAWSEGCVDLSCIAKFIHLNASTLSDPRSLFVTLSLFPHSISTHTLIDSGSLHCFINSSFVADHNIFATLIPLIGLHLFDRTCNSTITQAAKLLVKFPCGESFNLTFYVTLLDSSCSSVLGYNWLRQYNPLIDWSSGHIAFRSVDHRGPAPSASPVVAETLPHQPPLVNTPSDPAPISTPTPNSHTSRPHISMINAAAYLRASKLPSSVTFQLQLSPDGTLGRAAQEVSLDLSSVPKDYHEFTDVFSKGKADTLPQCS